MMTRASVWLILGENEIYGVTSVVFSLSSRRGLICEMY